ncbi:ATP-binding protein [Streptomyces sp. Root369]|uniref:ATP-binding protein n=1 Tax=Streptomyces sp. Root369 TaxID=1736523 RepID=UPI000710953F|nr:ATP-binding protein [Streptomyces sp. Root369]KQW03323.1 hypothetical protein ASD08_44290 [Streptomyces sp. Root369]
MTAPSPGTDGGQGLVFEDLIAERVTTFVPRPWLVNDIDRALSHDSTRIVLITGEPGAGKTSLLAGLAHTHPQWQHYFIRKDSRTALVGGDLQSCLLTVGHQLAHTRPELFEPQRLEVIVSQHIGTVEPGASAVGVRIDDLQASPFHRTAALRVEQDILRVSGSAVGVEIGAATVEPRLLEPGVLAHLALIGPAQVLASDSPDERIVILIDALDEGAHEPGATLLDWLATGPELPPNVRFVVTSRPHTALDRIRTARSQAVADIAIDPRSTQVREDLLTFTERELASGTADEVLRAHGRDAVEFARWLVQQASGNFLYLAMYLRALHQAIEENDTSLAARMMNADTVPHGLSGLYAFFVTTARADLERLGMLDISDPVTPTDLATPAWEGVAQPLLGVLTVAREPMTAEQLSKLAGIRVWPRAVRSVLARIRWLLTVRDGRYAFYHPSVAQFLTDPQTQRDLPDQGVAEQEWHERIVRHYRAAAPSWADVDWPAVDRYGLAHLAHHLVRCRPATADEVHELVCPGLRLAVRAAFGSDRYFTRVVETAADHLLDGTPRASSTPTMLFLATVRRQLRRATSMAVPAVYGLLARLGRVDEAVARLGAMPPSGQQLAAVLEVYRHTSHPVRRSSVRELLAEIATVTPVDRHGFARAPLAEAARTLAPHDLPLALRLWERAQHEAWKPAPPDDVYRAAAVSADTPDAIEFVAWISTGRAKAYLDLMDRDHSGDPTEPLVWAERALGHAAPAERVTCFVRLASAWRATRPAYADSLVERALKELAAAWPGEDEAVLVNAVAEAAGHAAGPYPAAARQLLGRLDAVEVTGLVDDAFLAAAGTWAALDDVAAARRQLERVLAFNHTVWTMNKVADVLAAFDPEAAAALIEDACSMIPPEESAQGMLGQMRRDGDLKTVAKALAGRDPGRAAAYARAIANTSWQPALTERYSTLALVAHRCADAGDLASARSILDEALRTAEQVPPVTDPELSGFYHLAPQRRGTEPAQPFGDAELEWVIVHNHTNDWQRLVEQRFHRDPSDVLRLMSPGTWSVGHPYSWGRAIRCFAEAVAQRDPAGARTLVHALTDAGERAVGLAGLFGLAAAGPDQSAADRLWAEFQEAYAAIPRYEWNLPQQEDGPLAYVRPDHRSRFEAAVRLLPWEADPAMAFLNADGTPYLVTMFHFAFGADASLRYAAAVAKGQQPYPPFTHMHRLLLGLSADVQGALFTGVLLAPAIVNERFATASGAPPAITSLPVVEDPLYASYADLMMRGPQAGTARLRSLMDTPRLPAVAALAATAAEHYGMRDERVATLCADVITVAERAEPALRAVTLLQLARSRATADLVDPEQLLEQTLNLSDSPSERVERDEVLRELFGILLVRRPGAALRLLYEQTTASWAMATALLENAVEPLLDALGTDGAILLHRAVRRALACTSTQDTGDSSIDGVRTTLGD